MTFWSIFSFEGRIRRLHFWLIRLGAFFVLAAIFLVPAIALGILADPDAESQSYEGTMGAAALPIVALWFVAVIAYVWIELAALVKRWHDRDKPGVMVLISFVPLIGPIWTLIECGFMEGTPGPNQYGPSPKAEHAVGVFS